MESDEGHQEVHLLYRLFDRGSAGLVVFLSYRLCPA
jgi:hypothetical protein